MTTNELAKITCYVYRNLSTVVTDTLRELKIPELFVQPGRTVMIRSRKRTLGLRGETAISEDAVDVYRFYVPLPYEERVVGLLASRADLTVPGRGSVYTEEVSVMRSRPLAFDRSRFEALPSYKLPVQTGFNGICCIVQRGEGNRIAQAVVEVGFSVPIVTYGKGMGIRDKLGLLRITIPVDKEVVSFVVNRQDAVHAMDLVIDTARLDHPGKGFIYLFPIRHGVINTKLQRGEFEHVASFEQIVSAIDELTGSAAWRRRATPLRPPSARPSRKILTELANYTIVCREGTAQQLVRAAMKAGAGGATLSKMRFGAFSSETIEIASRSREMSDLIIPRALGESVVDATGAAGIFDEETHGFIEVSSVEMASTYHAAPKR